MDAREPGLTFPLLIAPDAGGLPTRSASTQESSQDMNMTKRPNVGSATALTRGVASLRAGVRRVVLALANISEIDDSEHPAANPVDVEAGRAGETLGRRRSSPTLRGRQPLFRLSVHGSLAANCGKKQEVRTERLHWPWWRGHGMLLGVLASAVFWLLMLAPVWKRLL